MSSITVKPAHKLAPNDYVEPDSGFYGSVINVQFPVGTQSVYVTTVGNYHFTVQRNQELKVSEPA